MAFKRGSRRKGLNQSRNNRILSKKKRVAPPRTAEEFFAMSERSQDTWKNVAHVVSKMRSDGISLHHAAQQFGIDSRAVLRLGKSALRKQPNGRWAAKASDRLLRVLVVLTKEGPTEIAVRDSHQASQLRKYREAADKYLSTGDSSALQKFDGKYIVDVHGNKVELLTDTTELDRLGNEGDLSYESFYARSA